MDGTNLMSLYNELEALQYQKINRTKVLLIEEEGYSMKSFEQKLLSFGFSNLIVGKVSKDLIPIISNNAIQIVFTYYDLLKKSSFQPYFEEIEVRNIPIVCLLSSKINNGEPIINLNWHCLIKEEKIDQIQAFRLIHTFQYQWKNNQENISQGYFSNLYDTPFIKDYLFVKINNVLEKVMIKDILWIHSDGNYSIIQTKDKKFAVKVSLKKIQKRLPINSFIRVHRSYLIQQRKISKVDISGNRIYVDEHPLPLGRYYKSKVLSNLNKIG